MKKIYAYLLCAASMQLFFAGISNGQTTTLALKPPAGAITIDGNGQEWGDTLSYYNADSKIRYTLSNDKDKLYLVVKTKDPIAESNILVAGLTLSIDTKGRKKSSYTTTFPSNGDGPQGLLTKAGEEPLDQKALRAKFLHLKKIAVHGFKDISDDYIGTTNTYGIQVAVDYDDKGYLIYEEAIPLDLFHAGDLVKNEWSFNIKLNGLEKDAASTTPSMTDLSASPAGGGRGGGGGGGSRGGASRPNTNTTTPLGTRLTSSIDFWGKFNLAKAQ